MFSLWSRFSRIKSKSWSTRSGELAAVARLSPQCLHILFVGHQPTSVLNTRRRPRNSRRERRARVFGQITELVCGEDRFAMLDEIKVFGENEGLKRGLRVDYGYALGLSGYAMWG